MTPDPSQLALRLMDQDFALEPGRQYLIGSGSDCDFRVEGTDVAPHHVRLLVEGNGVQVVDLGSEMGTYRNGQRVDCARLTAGDALQFGDGVAVLTQDVGQAVIVPIPEMVADASRRRRVAALPGVRRFEEQSFHALMAEELRRTPWLGISLVFHALVLIALWLMYPARQPSGDALATVRLDYGGTAGMSGDADVRVPDVVIEPEPEMEVDIEDPVLTKPPVIEPDPPDNPLGAMKANPRLVKTPARQGAGSSRNLQGIGSEGFRKIVSDLQQTGLEIVFVFDSTGSMGTTIRDTKETIAEMLGVLRALVPDARVGLVTYRDRGQDEDYLLRQVALGHDFWQASNFVQNVVAEGGGDRPEAVRDALQAAFGQPWRRGSKRVVVLAGDAPPHRRDWKRMMNDIKAFAGSGESFVHTLVASPRDAGRDTHEQFQRIARAGSGECLALEKHEHVLQRVLDFAFGRQFDGDLAAVRKQLAADANKTETWALDLSRRGGSDLELALRERPVDAALLNALVRLPRRRVVEQLVRTLAYERTPPHTCQAIAWVLQRVFELSEPPVDPVSGEPASERTLAHLRSLARRLPR